MLREQVIIEWTGLKTKIQATQLSEKDKQVHYYLANESQLVNFSPHLVNQNLDQLASDFQTIQEKIDNLDPDHDLLVDFWFQSGRLVSLIINWIEIKKILNSYQETTSSEWKHWQEQINQLKETVNLPMLWGDDNLDELKGRLSSLKRQINSLNFVNDDDSGPTIEEVD